MSTAAVRAVNQRGQPTREIVIRPPSELLRFDFREYYRYRHLFQALVWRDIRVHFDEMYLGFLWACMRPLLYVVVFVAFRKLSGANTHVSIPYSLYIYSGLILWYYLLESVMQATGALRRDAGLLTKVYYPRLITPSVPIVANLVGFGIAVIPMVFMMAWNGIGPGWRLLLLPFVVLQCMALAMGIGTIFGSLTLTSRDWDRFLSNSLYLGLFVSPVIYAPDMIPSQARLAYFLNPMAGTLLAFRSALFAAYPFPLWQWAYSVAFSLAALALGTRMFRAAESQFADKL